MECLTSSTIRGVEVTCWVMEPNNTTSNDDQKPVDDLFTVHLSYQEDGLDDVNVKTIHVSLELKRESTYWEWQDAVMNCLKDNDVEINAWDYIVDVVVQSCEIMLDDVRDSGRKSLVMYVKAEVYHVDDEEGGDDHAYDDYDDEPMEMEEVEVPGLEEEEEEPMYLDDTDNEEIIEVRRKTYIEFCLEASGVGFYDGYSRAKENCSICLEEFGKSDNVAMLPCSHLSTTSNAIEAGQVVVYYE
uniref:RING-type domain-containing protein n=1 Tax=Chenopodium quinoa TaxID=63459 RepID=A0A803LGV8_CHEQI